MKRISIYVLFAICTWIALCSVDFVMTRQQWRDYYQRTFAKSTDRLTNEGYAGGSFWVARANLTELQDYLESRRRAHLIEFWVIKTPQTTLSEGLKGRDPNQIKFDLSQPHGPVERSGQNIYYTTEALGDGTHLIVGNIYDESGFLNKELNINLMLIIRSLAGAFAVVFLVFVYFFRDIRATINGLLSPSSGRRSIVGGGSSREADLLNRGVLAFDFKAKQLETEKNLYSWQVLPSLRTELSSGRAAPYEFACTLVRTDINNFSKIYNESPVEEFAATLNDFFTEVSHIVARYGGLVHEFVGDEVIFYFKDEEVGNSPAQALAALRDINEAAERIHKMTLRERGYPFTVKSSFAQGRLRFGKFVHAYSLAGPVLIETVRILSMINEKDGNVIVFDDRHLPQVEPIAQMEPYAQVRLKGFSNERHLLSCKAHYPIARFMGAMDVQHFNFLTHFRSDADIATMLAWARTHGESADPTLVSRLFGILRRVSVGQTNGVPQQHLLLWIEDLLRKSTDDRPGAESAGKILASALRLVENLVPPTEFSNQFAMALKRAVESKDRRVVANAIDVLAKFQGGEDAILSERLARHPDNRVAANALVLEGRRTISPFVVRRLRKMLSSRNVASMASGLFALGEIATHHRNADSVYYSTQVDFLKLIEWIPALATHDNPMVRRQAFIAAGKTADGAILKAVISGAKNHPEREAEVRIHLGSFMTAASILPQDREEKRSTSGKAAA